MFAQKVKAIEEKFYADNGIDRKAYEDSFNFLSQENQ